MGVQNNMAFTVTSMRISRVIHSRISLVSSYRFQYYSQASDPKKGLILGGYTNVKSAHCNKLTVDDFHLTTCGQNFNNQISNRLKDALNWSGVPKKGQARVLFGLDREFPAVAVVNLGPDSTEGKLQFQKDDEIEERDTFKENLRCGIAVGLKALRDVGVDVVSVDPCSDPECVAESAALTAWRFQGLKSESKRKSEVEIVLHSSEEKSEALWEKGLIQAGAQNLARWLTDMPSNHMTPTIFAQKALDLFDSSNVKVEIHDKAWAQEQGMNAYLAVAQGSEETPLFLEITYNNEPKQEKPIVIVGKGITFDSGGISIKPSANMDKMRGDMGGAACTLATLYAVSKLQLPLHVKGLIPLCENMPSGTAVKPGDVVTALNGKTIQIDNTDAEGRLILADALAYAQRQYQPNFIMNIATLTGAISVALGSASTGVFSNSNLAWTMLHQSGHATGDRVWRMPLWQHYGKQLDSPLADLNNIGTPGGGSCTAAAFLKEFVEAPHWMHLDIAGVGGVADNTPYLEKGMSGRPTRTLINLLSRISKKNMF